MPIDELVAIVSQFGPAYGPLVFAVLYFLYRDAKREDSMSRRIKALEEETRDTLIPLLKDTTAVIARNTTIMERLEKHLDR